jgi:hypothetical protein
MRLRLLRWFDRRRRNPSLHGKPRTSEVEKSRNERNNSHAKDVENNSNVRYLIRGGGRGPASKLALRSRVSCCEAKGSCRTSGEAPHRRAEPVPSAVGCL